MAHITIVAHITAQRELADMVQGELEKLIDITRAEQGCIRYDLHQDNNNPAHLMLYEIWESWSHWQVHRKTKHMMKFRAAVDGAIEEFLVHEMTKIA